jgi:hypothetical protein
MNSSVPGRIDTPTWIAMACIAIGWFWLNTLVAAFGPIQHAASFYDLPAVMKEPRWLLTGVSGAHSVGTLVFGFLCLAVVVSPLFPRLGYPRTAWFNVAPLALMLLCGIGLYVRASSARIEPGDSMGRLGGYVAHWANGAAAWGGDVLARHIALGAGGYLAFAASAWLAVRWVIELRTAGENDRLAA